jgi:hypothetical protein
LIWLDRAVVDRLRSLRGAGESYSDVILLIAGAKRRRARRAGGIIRGNRWTTSRWRDIDTTTVEPPER